jgi:acyl-CoA thioesterase FadM
MSFFAIPYRVLFHDTMAYGSHHYLTNLKFQNISRETLLFESRAGEGEGSGWQSQLANIVLLTREAYAKSFAPVGVGERVVIFQTYEEPTHSTVRLCFRVIRADGEPVSCGFQTMVAVDARTQRPCPAPRLVTQYVEKENPSSILEPAHDPSFRDRVLQGQGMS